MPLYDDCLHVLLNHEGGYSNNPNDFGKATNFGITQATYNAYLMAHGLPERDVKLINSNEVRYIYQMQFWQPSYAYLCEFGLAVTLLDTAVLFGPSTYKRFLRQATGVKPTFLQFIGEKLTATNNFVDGPLIEALKTCNQKEVALKLVDIRIAFHQAQVKKYPNQLTFLRGWTARSMDLKKRILDYYNK